MKSFRGQLILIFLSFILISLFTAYYTSIYYQQRQELIKLAQKLNEFEITILRSLNEQENFFNFETVNEGFYLTEESIYLTSYERKLQNLEQQIQELFAHESIQKRGLAKLENIRLLLADYKISFQTITNAIRARGFRDYGLIGKMRKAAHRLEDESLLKPAEILMLRRHEKDYIIRQDENYLSLHSKLVLQYLQELPKKTFPNVSDEKLSRSLLIEYDSLFKQMAKIEKAIGLKTNQGLKKTLNENITAIISELALLKEIILLNQKRQIEKLNYSLLIFWLIYLVVVIWSSIKLSNRFTYRLRQLSSHINYFVNTNFTARLRSDIKISEDEIGTLWGNFLKMENEIVDYLDLFKEKVDEKTIQLVKRNKQIEKQKKELEIQKTETEIKNKDLIDGMKYGWRIQQALLPTKIRFKKQVIDGFVLFRPKDIVSGDVYFTHKVLKKEGDENLFAVMDCTGHGVPGAFMSILAINALNKAILSIKHREANYIIQEANNFIYSSMKYYLNDFKKMNNKDGMDMLICNLKRDKRELSYAGAHRPLYLVRKRKGDGGIGLDESEYNKFEFADNLLYEIFPVKKTVGAIRPEESYLFCKKTIQVQKEDMLYLTSDGYADQFGGPNDKKFMAKRLKQFLCDLFELSAEEQKEQLETTFEDWKGENDQIDDVCVMGVRV